MSRPDEPLAAGDRVRILDGPFVDFTGAVARIDAETRMVVVVISFFERPTPVALKPGQIERLPKES